MHAPPSALSLFNRLLLFTEKPRYLRENSVRPDGEKEKERESRGERQTDRESERERERRGGSKGATLEIKCVDPVEGERGF